MVKPIASLREVKKDNLLLRRLFAFLLDLLILNIIIVAPFRQIILRLVPENVSFLEGLNLILARGDAFLMLQVVFIIIGIMTFFYFVLLEYSIDQTVGKIIMNLEIDGGDTRPGLLRILTRNFFLLPIFPFSLIWIFDLGYLLFFGKGGQRLTEHWSNTKIIKVVRNE